MTVHKLKIIMSKQPESTAMRRNILHSTLKCIIIVQPLHHSFRFPTMFQNILQTLGFNALNCRLSTSGWPVRPLFRWRNFTQILAGNLPELRAMDSTWILFPIISYGNPRRSLHSADFSDTDLVQSCRSRLRLSLQSQLTLNCIFRPSTILGLLSLSHATAPATVHQIFRPAMLRLLLLPSTTHHVAGSHPFYASMGTCPQPVHTTPHPTIISAYRTSQ